MTSLLSYTILYITASPIFGAIIALPAIASLFFNFFFVPFVILLIATIVMWRKKKTNLFLHFSIWLGLWQYGSFLSNVLSFRKFGEGEATYFWSWADGGKYPSIGSAGFPIKSHELSPYVLGNTVPPKEMWLDILLNHGIWLIIALIAASVLTSFLAKRSLKTKKNISWSFICLAFLGYFSYIGYYLLAFD